MTANKIPTQIKDVSLFQGLDDQQLAMIGGLLYRKVFAPGKMILTEGQPGEVVYIILQGTVKIFNTHTDGSEVIINILGAGDTVGEMSVVEDSIGRSASAVALEETEIVWMNRADFTRILDEIPPLMRNLMLILNGRLRMSTEQIQALAMLDVNGRVARQILAFAQRYGHDIGQGGVTIPIRLPQNEIADLVGASRKRVNQVMVNFKRDGVISVDQDYRITVLDKGVLEQYC